MRSLEQNSPVTVVKPLHREISIVCAPVRCSAVFEHCIRVVSLSPNSATGTAAGRKAVTSESGLELLRYQCVLCFCVRYLPSAKMKAGFRY